MKKEHLLDTAFHTRRLCNLSYDGIIIVGILGLSFRSSVGYESRPEY